jgi:glycosyltransferase involved in cell wall biosynthesis
MDATKDGITVVIPSIPPRWDLLGRAVKSVEAQTLRPAAVVVDVDHGREGAPAVRTRALARVKTPFVAFLDDDDELLPEHLAKLAAHMNATGADLVYSWFTVVGGEDPFPQNFGRPWDNASPVQTTITTLAKTAAIRDVGGFVAETFGDDGHGNRAGEDFLMVLRLVERGYKIAHLAERTWLWHHHRANTSGAPDRW